MSKKNDLKKHQANTRSNYKTSTKIRLFYFIILNNLAYISSLLFPEHQDFSFSLIYTRSFFICLK